MLKYLLLLLALVWLFYSPALRGLRGGTARQGKAAPKAPQPVTKDMVGCAHCGVHLPTDEAVRAADGQSYCSNAHRQAGLAAR
jgi:uncharacterized protein